MDPNIKKLPAGECENPDAWRLAAVPVHPEQKRRFDAWYSASEEILGAFNYDRPTLWQGWIASWSTNQKIEAAAISSSVTANHDLIEIARTVAAMAAQRDKMTVQELQTAPCPLDPASPLVRAARAACVVLGYNSDGSEKR